MIYKLGDHIVAQGDATDAEFVSRVTKGISVRSVVCDPPYGVAYVENKDWMGMRGEESAHFKAHKKIAGDELQTEREYAEFTEKWIDAVKPNLTPKNTFYIFNSDWMICALREGMKAAGLYYSQLIIWVKNSIVLGRKDYNPQHELIAYGWFGSHKFERGKAKSVLFCPKPTKAKLHPTMKPVELLRKIIANSTKTGEWVYDPFLGSGSTLIACEHLGRRCVGIELDKGYVLTAVARWEKLTGLKAVLVDPEGNKATTMSHTGRSRGKRGIGAVEGDRAKKGDKIGVNRV
jgi:site-specific DNA-methyltransferase (adenine-specific)